MLTKITVGLAVLILGLCVSVQAQTRGPNLRAICRRQNQTCVSRETQNGRFNEVTNIFNSHCRVKTRNWRNVSRCELAAANCHMTLIACSTFSCENVRRALGIGVAPTTPRGPTPHTPAPAPTPPTTRGIPPPRTPRPNTTHRTPRTTSRRTPRPRTTTRRTPTTRRSGPRSTTQRRTPRPRTTTLNIPTSRRSGPRSTTQRRTPRPRTTTLRIPTTRTARPPGPSD